MHARFGQLAGLRYLRPLEHPDYLADPTTRLLLLGPNDQVRNFCADGAAVPTILAGVRTQRAQPATAVLQVPTFDRASTQLHHAPARVLVHALGCCDEMLA